jgi:hypothetical protein
MRRNILKITTALVFGYLMIIPLNPGQSQITDIINFAMNLSHNVSTFYTTAQTAQQVEGVLEEIACAKIKYDKYRDQITIKSCLTRAQFKILDVELSSVYTDIASTASGLLSTNGSDQAGQSKLTDILTKLKSIAEKMKLFNDGVEMQVIEERKEEGAVNFTASGLSRSF